MILITVFFSFLRPHHSVVYAPKLKYADEKHVPPEIGNGLFAWFAPVTTTKEALLVEKVGMDGALFLRFTRMCRNMFLALSIISIAVLIPANTIGSNKTPQSDGADKFFVAMTPEFIKAKALWAHVVSAYFIDIIIAFFLWRNYLAVKRLRKQYFQSPEYLKSLHSRTLMITDIPPSSRTDEGVLRLLDGVEKTAGLPRASIGRNVKELPDLIEEHEETVRKLESVLARYLKNPDRLPSARPVIRPSRKYRQNNGDDKVDAIDYLTGRIRELEAEIVHVRDLIDKRNAMPYGFAIYEKIEEAHIVALEARKKHPQGTTVELAPKPSNLIWKNLPLSKKARKWKRFVNEMWIVALTLIWIAPNALIAVFLSNLSNLALVWPAFKKNFDAHHVTWSAVQGIASPALISFVYLILPIIFRRLSTKAGDLSKTSREHHVMTKLYAFFVFNNLIIFSVFSTVWAFIASVVNRDNKTSFWDAVKESKFVDQMMYGLSKISPFWLTWLLQRNLGAAIDLAQLINLTWVWFCRTFRSPTPRQAIEWTAPTPFDFAVYLNYFLFYATVALSYATLQPLVLPVTAVYFVVDYWLKKYLLLYVFITKNESGGQYWRIIYNRIVFAVILSNFVFALVIKGAGGTWTKVLCMAPLPILMGVFKWYCSHTFDDETMFITKATPKDSESMSVSDSKVRQSDRVASKFGHPALYKPLMTPMVHAKARNVLSQVYRGRIDTDEMPPAQYADIAMESMEHSHPGKTARLAPRSGKNELFEVVPESQLDFAYYKDRSEFRENHGGDGGIYGRPTDLVSERSNTPRSFFGRSSDSTESSRASSMEHDRRVSQHRSVRAHRTDSPLRDQVHRRAESPATGRDIYHFRTESESALLRGAQPVGTDGPGDDNDRDDDKEQYDLDRWRTGGSGYVGIPGVETHDERLGYDAYRGRR